MWCQEKRESRLMPKTDQLLRGGRGQCCGSEDATYQWSGSSRNDAISGCKKCAGPKRVGDDDPVMIGIIRG